MANFRLIQVNKLTINGPILWEKIHHSKPLPLGEGSAVTRSFEFHPALKLYKMPFQARSIEMG